MESDQIPVLPEVPHPGISIVHGTRGDTINLDETNWYVTDLGIYDHHTPSNTVLVGPKRSDYFIRVRTLTAAIEVALALIRESWALSSE